MTILLGYIDCYITLKNIMLVTFHYAVIMINTLMRSKKHWCEAINYAFCLLYVYMLAMLVKRNSAYSFHLETIKSLSLGRILR